MGRPSSISSSDGARRLIAIVVALAVLVAIEGLFALVLPESRMVMLFKQIRQDPLRSERVDIEIVGDSVGRSGLWPHVMAGELGHRVTVRNASMPGSGPVFSYLRLRDLIAAGDVPKYIIYSHAPVTFDMVRHSILISSFCTWPETLSMFRYDDPYRVIYGILNRFSYTLRYRSQFKKLLEGDATFFIGDHPPLAGEAWYDRAERKVERHDFSVPLDEYYDKPFAVMELNRLCIRQFVALAAKHDVTVLWVTMPVPQQLYDKRERSGFMADYYDFIDRLEYDNLIMVQREFTVDDDDLFADASHFNAEGGIAFSRRIAGQLATLIAE
jgi:hypothetical protein